MEQSIKADLRKVPAEELKFTLQQLTGEELRAHVPKETLIQLILQHMTAGSASFSHQIQSLAQSYKFAGKGSICWSFPHPEVYLSQEDLVNKIKDKFKADIFDKEVRPKPTKKPALNRAEWLTKDKVRLEYVSVEREFLVEENYDVRPVTPMTRITTLIRLVEPTFGETEVTSNKADSNELKVPVIEVRADLHKAKVLHQNISDTLGIPTSIVEFTDEDLHTLKEKLSAKMRSARHKRYAGDIDVVEFTAYPGIDLEKCADYTSFSKDEFKRARYVFSYAIENGSTIDVSIHVTNKGSVWFVSDVPEEVVEHVFSSIAEIKLKKN